MPGLRLSSSIRHLTTTLAATLIIGMAFSGSPRMAHALSEPEKNQGPVEDQSGAQENPDADEEKAIEDEKQGIPMPDGLISKPSSKAEDMLPDDDKADTPDIPTEIILDPSKLPEPVQKLRVAIVEAAASGDIERLRPLLGTGPDATQISIGDAPEDPIAALKSLSGDQQGQEILAILLDILSTSAAHVDKGTPNELFVWPYFAEKPLESLTPPEMVELFRIVTASDVADMKEFGGYNFYRIGISPDGRWKFFVAGD